MGVAHNTFASGGSNPQGLDNPLALGVEETERKLNPRCRVVVVTAAAALGGIVGIGVLSRTYLLFVYLFVCAVCIGALTPFFFSILEREGLHT
eukprot:gene987-582_t